MSSEYKDWINDIKEEAKRWVEKYPFLRYKNNACCPWNNVEEIESCWIFDLPDGWINGFGEQMCDELLDALGKYADYFIIDQLKEKFNEIRLYWSWQDREYTETEIVEMNKIYNTIEYIINKYARISYNTCTICGRPATEWINSGWFASFCDRCYERMNNRWR